MSRNAWINQIPTVNFPQLLNSQASPERTRDLPVLGSAAWENPLKSFDENLRLGQAQPVQEQAPAVQEIPALEPVTVSKALVPAPEGPKGLALGLGIAALIAVLLTGLGIFLATRYWKNKNP